MIKTDLAIVGSGLAALNLVKELRKAGDERHIAVITKEQGHFYSKPMLSNALSKAKTPENLPVQGADAFADQFKVQLLANSSVMSFDLAQKTLLVKAEALGEVTSDADNAVAEQSIKWSQLVLAVGAEPVSLANVGVEVSAPVYTVNQLSEYAEFHQALMALTADRGAENVRVGIVGSGLIGCEFANDLANQGYQVSVIDMTDRPMARLLPPALSAELGQSLTDLGVQWHWSQSVSRVSALSNGASDGQASNTQPHPVRIETAQGLSVEVDLVLSAIGLKPNTTLAQTAGLQCGPGIQVDATLKASHPDVYALGDCATVGGVSLQYVLPLMASARSLAKTLMGQETQVVYPAMPVVVKTPACPTVVAIPPTVPAEAEWQIIGEGRDLSATLLDAEGQTIGFALIGDAVKQKNVLAKSLPAWL